MKIPLLCNVNNDSLTIVRNGVGETVPLPFKPFTYVPSASGTISRYLIGSKDRVLLESLEADDIEGMKVLRARTGANIMDYQEQIYCYRPQFFYSYPNEDPLKVMVVDLEVLTDGSGIFPRPTTQPIVAIGYKIVGTDRTYIRAITRAELDSGMPDEGIIYEFLEDLAELDPDIVAGYNSIKFDIPFLLGRMGEYEISSATLCRGVGYEVEDPRDLGLRIHWDMWRDVDNDQTLLGLPNRRLKTVANHFGWSDIIDLGREALSNTTPLVGTPELEEYLSSDIRLTEQLTDVYLGNHIAISELMGFPLRETINAYSSMVSKVNHVRNLHRTHIGIKTNRERYEGLLGTVRYEAAKVGIYKDGVQLEKNTPLREFFPRVWKVDFSSQYPTAMETFNLSPETTFFREVREYSGEYKFRRRGKQLYLNIPDKNCQKDIVIQIDLRKEGFMRIQQRERRLERKKLKELSKQNPDDKGIYSRNWALKVEMNTEYGYEGLESSKG